MGSPPLDEKDQSYCFDNRDPEDRTERWMGEEKEDGRGVSIKGDIPQPCCVLRT